MCHLNSRTIIFDDASFPGLACPMVHLKFKSGINASTIDVDANYLRHTMLRSGFSTYPFVAPSVTLAIHFALRLVLVGEGDIASRFLLQREREGGITIEIASAATRACVLVFPILCYISTPKKMKQDPFTRRGEAATPDAPL
jgi:hypothetical protein